jgi:ActR/RegA family two-component response regulator
MIFHGENPHIENQACPILIVDDQPEGAVRELVADRFRRWGYSVLVASEAREALDLLESANPALVVVGEIDEGSGVSSFLRRLEISFAEKAPAVCLIVGTWQYLHLVPDREPMVSLSRPMKLCELLDFAGELCAA